eukprot:GILI01028257.1.p1 GENE.GILI01028257.1~~GILI01028257.1.p1  ORF type:complete len:294 (-),score=91.57 GILI01028257.1:339-1148(-)
MKEKMAQLTNQIEAAKISAAKKAEEESLLQSLSRSFHVLSLCVPWRLSLMTSHQLSVEFNLDVNAPLRLVVMLSLRNQSIVESVSVSADQVKVESVLTPLFQATLNSVRATITQALACDTSVSGGKKVSQLSLKSLGCSVLDPVAVQLMRFARVRKELLGLEKIVNLRAVSDVSDSTSVTFTSEHILLSPAVHVSLEWRLPVSYPAGPVSLAVSSVLGTDEGKVKKVVERLVLADAKEEGERKSGVLGYGRATKLCLSLQDAMEKGEHM